MQYLLSIDDVEQIYTNDQVQYLVNGCQSAVYSEVVKSRRYLAECSGDDPTTAKIFKSETSAGTSRGQCLVQYSMTMIARPGLLDHP